MLLWFSTLFLYFMRYLITGIPYLSLFKKLESIITMVNITTETVAWTPTTEVHIPLKLSAYISIKQRQFFITSAITPKTNIPSESQKIIFYSFLIFLYIYFIYSNIFTIDLLCFSHRNPNHFISTNLCADFIKSIISPLYDLCMLRYLSMNRS